MKTFVYQQKEACVSYPDCNIQREFDVEVAFQLASCKLQMSNVLYNN